MPHCIKILYTSNHLFNKAYLLIFPILYLFIIRYLYKQYIIQCDDSAKIRSRFIALRHLASVRVHIQAVRLFPDDERGEISFPTFLFGLAILGAKYASIGEAMS